MKLKITAKLSPESVRTTRSKRSGFGDDPELNAWIADFLQENGFILTNDRKRRIYDRYSALEDDYGDDVFDRLEDDLNDMAFTDEQDGYPWTQGE